MPEDMPNKQSVREGLIQVLSVERFQAKPRAGSNTTVVVMEQTGKALRHYGTLLPGQDALSIGERLWGKFVCYVVDMAERELHIDQKFLTYDRVASVRVQADVVYQVVDAERVAIRVEDAVKSLNTELLALLEREIVRLPLEQVTAQHLEDYLKRESRGWRADLASRSNVRGYAWSGMRNCSPSAPKTRNDVETGNWRMNSVDGGKAWKWKMWRISTR